ncbi:hypothetical protein C9374_005088 [Naegleria lovaniensis]|uniref:Uncharacterized protein n=1 Tax=Naegleria lovaniensis TaxID=51637 RepID=A0AA88GQ57_NAELO|nr:uncharacterized protein C9374_005088 [Naegleria lovaniensis]KAG2382508.1 hypothetical protein C9374_005088 [Naegleria lovaniensis]
MISSDENDLRLMNQQAPSIPHMIVLHECGEWNETDFMLKTSEPNTMLLLGDYQLCSHESLPIKNLNHFGQTLVIGCISRKELQFSHEESYLTSFICDPSNSFLIHFIDPKKYENNKLNGYLFLTQSNNNQLFEILMHHFDRYIEEYIQSNTNLKLWTNHANFTKLLKHLLLSLILLAKFQQQVKASKDFSLVMRQQERTWLNQICLETQDSIWHDLYEKVHNFLKQVENNHQERIQKFNTLLSSQSCSKKVFRASKL